MTRRAIELLQWNTGGYLLIVDAGLMRTAARENHGERTLAETIELDQAIAVASSYMGENSTILVAGNLGIGGLSLNGTPFRKDSGVALLGVNSSGEPALTWATGPNGTNTRGPLPGPKSGRKNPPRRAKVPTTQIAGTGRGLRAGGAQHGQRCSRCRSRPGNGGSSTVFWITR